MSLMRLDRFLALGGGGTRSEAKRCLRAGRVTVNGVPEKQADRKVSPETDMVCLDGRRISWEPFVCLMLNKPRGCVTATEDRDAKTVMDYIEHDRKKELFPVGRLDRDTEGLLFLMNDGALAHRMLSPAHHVQKTYFVRVEGDITDAVADALRKGVEIGEKHPTLPAGLTVLSRGDISEAELTITEGKYHQVRRMFAACGKRVIYLKRTAMAGIRLDESLGPGRWRELTEDERNLLRQEAYASGIQKG